MDHDDLERLLLARNPRFQALMAQAEENIKAGRTPVIAEPQADYQVDIE